MIEELARVVGIEGSELVLEAEIKTSCQSCSASKGCGTSLLAQHTGRRMTHFRAHNTLGARVGDTVVVGLDEGAMLRGSLLVYLYPLCSMILAALVADAVLDAGDYKDLLTALAALAGLTLSVTGMRRWLAGRNRQQQLKPVLIRKQLAVT